MVPHLLTALQGPISELEQRILESTPAIERWFRLEWMEHTPAVYSAVAIRNAGYKLAPTQVDLFPSGWNRLSDAMVPLAAQAAQAAVEKFCPDARNLLIVPHNGAQRDADYLLSLSRLRQIFSQAGLHVRLGSIDPDVSKTLSLKLPSGEQLALEPAVRSQGRLQLKHFDPCAILLNSDLYDGVPGILEDLNDQYMLPPLQASWATRLRSRDLVHYEEISKRFGKMLGIDPWLIHPIEEAVGLVDLSTEDGVARVRASVDSVLARIRRKCKEYGIGERPFVTVKLDNGGDEAGVMTLRDASELPGPSAVQPHLARLIVQEGLQTSERVGQAVAEPVIYTIDRYVVGAYYRCNTRLTEFDSLDAADTTFAALPFARVDVAEAAQEPNRFYMHGVIARLAMLATSYELEAAELDADGR
ncbi:glutamate--cysteine ligase [Comamonas serinivorans]|uniref:Glutamate--cysteine ligase n=1 Tax=Comamonas serinivorans TaxID=1082851 RepID=A0A1Y0EJL4_9BURK|nr:glutamate--cysteine ligase [Comamonas serinivorans]ARU03559.1 glutamate--cysteine ligase [Comamonas serinivorans]